MNRPPDRAARSHAAWAVTIGLRGKAMATSVPSTMLSAASAARAQAMNGLWAASVTHRPAKPAAWAWPAIAPIRAGCGSVQ